MKSVVRIRMFRAAAVLLCGAGLAVGAAVAQQDGPPPHGQQQPGPPPAERHGWNPDRRAEMMQKRLGLSGDQTAQVKAILIDEQAKMEALRANASPGSANPRGQGMALRQEEDAKIEAILTPDQKAKYEEMKAQQRERMQERRQRQGGDEPAPPPPPAPQQ
jgi:protein CpxP